MISLGVFTNELSMFFVAVTISLGVFTNELSMFFLAVTISFAYSIPSSVI